MMKKQGIGIKLSESQLETIVQSHDQERSELNSTIIASGGDHTFIEVKIIKGDSIHKNTQLMLIT